MPALFCGIAGLKPTPGRISTIGHRPAEGVAGITVMGPMARSVADVRLLFDVLAGFDERDPLSAPVALTEASAGDLRIGVMEQFGGVPVQAAIHKAVLDAAASASPASVSRSTSFIPRESSARPIFGIFSSASCPRAA